MITSRRLQSSFAEGLIAEEVGDLWEPWMRHADAALRDDQLLEIIQQELSKRCKKSKTRGRPATTAEVILRMLLLKHMRDWSYADVSREVRANLVYRQFTGIGGGKVPDDKTMGRLGRQLGPEIVEKLHQRMVAIAQEKAYRERTQNEGRHDGGRDQHSLPHRQHIDERRSSCADSSDEEGRGSGG
jgi:transposase, IS5 family